MATTITYVVALQSILDFATDNGFDNEEVITKVKKLINQKQPKGGSGKKSTARKDNENIARKVADLMRKTGTTEIRASWVRDNLAEVSTVPKAVAILNAADEEGILVKNIVAKSPTRNELVYTLPTE